MANPILLAQEGYATEAGIHVNEGTAEKGFMEFERVPHASATNRIFLRASVSLHGPGPAEAAIYLYEADLSIKTNNWTGGSKFATVEPEPDNGTRWLDMSDFLKTNTWRKLGVRFEIENAENDWYDAGAELVSISPDTINRPPVLEVKGPVPEVVTASETIEIAARAEDPNGRILNVQMYHNYQNQ